MLGYGLDRLLITLKGWYMSVCVIDSVMGSGKTQGMIKFMEGEVDKKWLYISPFISEVGEGNTGVKGRLQECIPDIFPISSMPKNRGKGKLEHLKDMVRAGVNIAATHALLLLFDDEVTDMILEQGYCVVIDEAVDCIQVKDDLTKKEVEALVNSEWIQVEEGTNLVSWNEDKNPEYDGRYGDIRGLCRTKALRLFEDRFMVVEYSPRLLKECHECYIMTYLFEGSLMSCWMKINEVDYETLDNSVFGLRHAKELKEEIRSKLKILTSRKIDSRYTREADIQYRYSSTWYKKNSTLTERLEVRKALENCVSNHKTKESKVFWTTFKDFRERIEGKGYKKSFVDPDTGVELDSFLPYNVKAINDYMHYDLVMHTVNLFRSPVEVRYLKWRGVKFEDDVYALSELLQFVWRSRIRQGMNTKVLVISKRMRNLLINWLKEDV